MNFQKRALYRLQILHRKLSIFIKWTDFHENQHFQEIICLILIRFQRSYTVQCHYMKNCLFLSNHQISVKLQISRKLKIYQILANFPKRAFYHVLYLSEILPQWLKWTDFKGFLATNFKRESHTVCCTSIIKSPDFKEIKEITDFNQFSRESLIPFSVKWTDFSGFL